MTPDALTRQQRLVLACTPHLQQLLDALNPHSALRVRELTLDPSIPHVLEVDCRVSGLDAAAALAWAEANSTGPTLRVDTPTLRTRACTLWFGKVRIQHLPEAYLRLEVPLATLTRTKRHESLLVLTSGAEATALEAWAANERERLAEDGVERYLRPVLSQAEAFGFEAVALGLRAAMLRLTPTKAAGLFGCVVPVLMSGWIRAWAQALAMSAPRLTRVDAEFVAEVADGESPPACPRVGRLHLIGSDGESLWIRAGEREPGCEGDAPRGQIERLRLLTGTSLETPDAAVSFLEEVAALMRLQYRANGASEIDLPSASAITQAELGRTPHTN